MHQTESLAKVLHVRENEKKDAQLAHHQSIDFFEKIATELYTLLRKKEDAEESYEKFIQDTTPIDKIRNQVTYIESLNKQIIDMQSKVTKARNKMETKQVKLTDAHVEVKKFEKIIEYRQNEQKLINLRRDQATMDEISIQQYLSQRLGV